MSETNNEAMLNVRKIIPLDDVRAEFIDKNEQSRLENDSLLSDSVGRTDDSNFNELEETMYTLENSIDSIAPRVPIVPARQIENIKINAQRKLAKKSVREELKDIKFNVKPELANLDNTIILNAEVLKQGLIYSEKKKNQDKINKIGITITVILFVLLMLFALSIPFIINYL